MTLGQFDNTIASFFASHIDLRGYWTAAVSSEAIGKELKPIIHDEFKKQGIQRVGEVAVNNPQPEVGGAQSMFYEFEGGFPIPAISKEIDIPDVGSRMLEIEKGRMPITGILAVWKDGNGTAFAAGGAYPKKNYFKHGAFSLSGGSEERGINVTVSVDLDLSPDQIRRDLIDLIESTTVEKESEN